MPYLRQRLVYSAPAAFCDSVTLIFATNTNTTTNNNNKVAETDPANGNTRAKLHIKNQKDTLRSATSPKCQTQIYC